MKNEHITPKKSLGQNFLINQRIIERIISSCNLKPTDTVVEIGPGKGALTKHLAEKVEKLITIEKDATLANYLIQNLNYPNMTVYNDDILEFDFNKLPDRFVLIGNLPYNVATPIIEKAIAFRHKISSFFMTVQLEHGKRITARANSKDYGSLSCFIEYYADTEILFRIKNTCFHPIPKVESCFLRLLPLKETRHKIKKENELFELIQRTFQHRRKTIENSLGYIISKEKAEETLKQLNINKKLRPENLSLSDFVNIHSFIQKH